MKTTIKKYYRCLFYFLFGGLLVSTIAYNVMGRAVGFENISITSLIPGFSIGSVSALIISFLVIRNRNLLLERLEAEQKLASELRNEIDVRKKAEAALKTSTEEAELANRTKSEFLANMSHELRTPLNAIIGFSETIRRQTFGPVGSPKYVEYIEDINQAGEHLLKIINDILDLSKIEAGRVDLHEEAVDVAEVVASCLLLVRERAWDKGVRLGLELADHPASLYADQRMLKQILINLLSNGIKFTPSGGEVKITSRFSRNAGYFFEVSDTGIGITEEDIPAALAPFRQVDSDLNRSFDGTGLGLPLSKSLTELHGGSLELRSQPGIGTTVTVRFPADRIIPPTPARPESAKLNHPAS